MFAESPASRLRARTTIYCGMKRARPSILPPPPQEIVHALKFPPPRRTTCARRRGEEQRRGVPRQKDAGDADAICDFYDARAREPVACARFGVCKILPSGNGKEWRAAARVEEAVSLNFTPQNSRARARRQRRNERWGGRDLRSAKSPRLRPRLTAEFYDPNEPIACPASLSISRRLSATGVNSVRELIILDARRSDVYV